jgi:pullulanase/glycogen debranching enzyme
VKSLSQRTLAFILWALLYSCANDNYVRLYHTEPKAPSYNAQDIEALNLLGPTLVDKGVNFGVYSERAERMEVLLFDDPESNLPTRQFPMAFSLQMQLQRGSSCHLSLTLLIWLDLT